MIGHDFEANAADDPRAFAVLLHPHPDYGGDRFHPFVGGLFQRLPGIGISAIRFNFISGSPAAARDQTVNALDDGVQRWPNVPAILAGYSFGAGVAASVGDPRVAGWYLLAPQVEALATTAIGADPRPKTIVVPERDQFSPPARVEPAVSTWQATTVTTIAGVDHYLGVVEPIVTAALDWIGATLD